MTKPHALTLVTLLTLSAACPRKPEVKLTGASVRELSTERGSLEVLLNVYNPNAFRIEVTRLTYELVAGSVRFGGGAADTVLTLGARGTATVRLPVEIDWIQLGATALDLSRKGARVYRVKGELTVVTEHGGFTRGYDEGLADLIQGSM